MKKENNTKRKIFVTVGTYCDDDQILSCFSWKTLQDARKGFFDSDYQVNMISDDEMSDDEVSAIFGECDREKGIYEITMGIEKLSGCPCCGI